MDARALAVAGALFAVGCGPGTAGDDPDGGDTVVDTDTDTDPGTDTDTDTDTVTVTGATGDTGGGCAACDDGLDCSLDQCEPDGACTHTVAYPCVWPAFDVDYLTYVESDLERGESGATWNAATDRLWIVGGGFGTSDVHRLAEQGGSWVIDQAGPNAAAWTDGDLDMEDVTKVDPVGQPNVVYVVSEGGDSAIVALDLAVGGQTEWIQVWDITPFIPPFSLTLGAEGLTFVPDDALAAHGFTDPAGAPQVSSGGMGGLFFVGHQNGGRIYVFDLAPAGGVNLVGAYGTGNTETAGLSFDADTGRLYLWHGDSNELEITRLSSTVGADGPRFDTEYVFDYPGADNIEGVALSPVADCDDDGLRRLFLIEDDGGSEAVELWNDWPLCER